MKALRAMKAALERRSVTRALTKHDGSVVRAARELKVDPQIIRRIVRRERLQHLLKCHQGERPLQGNAAWRALDDEVCA